MTATIATLSDPINSSLLGDHARFRISRGNVHRYDPEVSVFFGIPAELTPADYTDLAALANPDGTLSLRDRTTPLPAGWELLESFTLVQYSGAAVQGEPFAQAVVLTEADVPEMTALVQRTNPGPFLPRTIELGTYLGVRSPAGDLIAMAGERLRPVGWTEISAVCTAPEARGQGLATRLIHAVVDNIRADGRTPFLHTSGDNPARRLYEHLGFELNLEVKLDIVRVPGTDASAGAGAEPEARAQT